MLPFRFFVDVAGKATGANRARYFATDFRLISTFRPYAIRVRIPSRHHAETVYRLLQSVEHASSRLIQSAASASGTTKPGNSCPVTTVLPSFLPCVALRATVLSDGKITGAEDLTRLFRAMQSRQNTAFRAVPNSSKPSRVFPMHPDRKLSDFFLTCCGMWQPVEQ